METAQIVAKKLMMEIIPRFGLFLTLGSDNGLAFMTKLSHMTSKGLSINWRLHSMCHPQSPGKVERTNRTLKETLTKYVLETDGNCVDLLPFAPTKGLLHPLLQTIHSM